MFSDATGRSDRLTRYPSLSPLGPCSHSGDRARAFRIASDRILNAVITVDFPALLGPTRTLKVESDNEYCLKALQFRNVTDVNRPMVRPPRALDSRAN